MATIDDVARLAKVSKATVSRVLTNSRQVRESSRQAVLAAASELNYTPSEIARSLATQSTDCIGFVTRDMSSFRFARIMDSLVQSAKPLGKHILPVCSRNLALQEQQSLSFLTSKQCEAIILDSSALDSRALSQFSDTHHLPPVILFDRQTHSHLFPYLACDYQEMVASACNYLLAQKHRHIALFTAQHIDDELKKGMKIALTANALPMNPLLQVSGIDDGSQAVMQLINRHVEFSAIITTTALQAVMAMNTLRAYGKQVPEEVSIISLEDSVLAENAYPGITAIEQPLEIMAEQAVSMAMEIRHRLGCVGDKFITSSLPGQSDSAQIGAALA